MARAQGQGADTIAGANQNHFTNTSRSSFDIDLYQAFAEVNPAARHPTREDERKPRVRFPGFPQIQLLRQILRLLADHLVADEQIVRVGKMLENTGEQIEAAAGELERAVK